jgi:hypothetical protein
LLVKRRNFNLINNIPPSESGNKSDGLFQLQFGSSVSPLLPAPFDVWLQHKQIVALDTGQKLADHTVVVFVLGIILLRFRAILSHMGIAQQNSWPIYLGYRF